MDSIPSPVSTDSEDVVRALQTADAFWTRGEHDEALVWLRRAAQAAGEAHDDERTLVLAQCAAELTEWLARGRDPHRPDDEPPVSDARPIYDSPPALPAAEEAEEAEADEEVETGQYVSLKVHKAERFLEPPAPSSGLFDPWSEPGAEPEYRPASASDTGLEAGEVLTSAPPLMKVTSDSGIVIRASIGDNRPTARPPASTTVPVAAVLPTPVAPLPPPGPPHAVGPRRPPPPLPRAMHQTPAPPRGGDRSTSAPESMTDSAPVEEIAAEDIVLIGPDDSGEQNESPHASADAECERTMESSGRADHHRVSPTPPSFRATEHPTSPPPLGATTSEILAAAEAQEKIAQAAPRDDVPTRRTSAVVSPVSPASPGGDEGRALSLEQTPDFADLPDEVRRDFAASARIRALGREEEVSGFALALVLEGEVDLAATIVDIVAQRLSAGTVVRARGSVVPTVPLRLIACSPFAKLALWDEVAVRQAFRACPWVEDELHTKADRLFALVGATMGSLGERLDLALREAVIRRLELRFVAEGELVVSEGQPVSGLVLVGAGELELEKQGTVTASVGTGELLFPAEVLRWASAPASARAGRGGALVLCANRALTQELEMSVPPLLEAMADAE